MLRSGLQSSRLIIIESEIERPGRGDANRAGSLQSNLQRKEPKLMTKQPLLQTGPVEHGKECPQQLEATDQPATQWVYLSSVTQNDTWLTGSNDNRSS